MSLISGKKPVHIQDLASSEKDPEIQMQKYFAGNLKFDVTQLSRPAPDIAVRLAKDENINILMKSFAEFGVKQTLDIKVVIRSISAYHTHIAPADKRQPKKKLIAADLRTLITAGRKLEVVIGDHSSQALALLTTQSEREDFRMVPMSFYIIPWDQAKPDLCAKLLELIRSFGLQDNILKDRRTAMAVGDLCRNLRSFYLAGLAAGKPDKDARKYAKEQFQATTGATWKLGTLNTWLQFCAAPERQFSLMTDVIDGKVMKTKKVNFKAPSSPVFMQVTGDLDTALVCKFLEQVTSGRDSVADFQFKCKKHRSIALMRKKIVELYYDDTSKKWADMETEVGTVKLSAAYDQKFWETWGERAGRTPGVAAVIPVGFDRTVADINRILSQSESSSSERSQVFIFYTPCLLWHI